MLNNEEGEVFSDNSFFNEQFIKKNKIKRITGRISQKAVYDQIKKDSNILVYEFLPNGKLTKQYATHKFNGSWDTIVQIYKYNSQGQLSILRKSDRYGFYATYFFFDSIGRIIKKEFRRDLNGNSSKINFELDKSLIFNEEVFTYSSSKLIKKCIFYNSYNRPFKEEFKYYNQDGYLTKEEYILKMSKIRTTKTYTYNHKGLLFSIEKKSTLKNNIPKKQEFFYDELNNLVQVKYYKGDIYIKEKQLLYNRVSKLLKTVLTREVKSNFIKILALDEYEFYD